MDYIGYSVFEQTTEWITEDHVNCVTVWTAYDQSSSIQHCLPIMT